jgi:hypothetical protein
MGVAVLFAAVVVAIFSSSWSPIGGFDPGRGTENETCSAAPSPAAPQSKVIGMPGADCESTDHPSARGILMRGVDGI